MHEERVKHAAQEGKSSSYKPPCTMNHCHILCLPAVEGSGMTELGAVEFIFPREQKMKGRPTHSPAPLLGKQPQLD